MARAFHPTTPSTSNSFGLAPGVAATPAATQRSPWHSPVPYLFGGLAAMLGLIAFALLILACSYWRLSSDDDDGNQLDDLEKGDGISKFKNPPVYEEKIVVIMAGDDTPSFLANPVKIFLSPFISNQDVNKIGAQDEKSTQVMLLMKLISLRKMEMFNTMKMGLSHIDKSNYKESLLQRHKSILSN